MSDRRVSLPIECEYVDCPPAPARLVLTMIDDYSPRVTDVIGTLTVAVEMPPGNATVSGIVYAHYALAFTRELAALQVGDAKVARLFDWDGVSEVLFESLDEPEGAVGISGVFCGGFPHLYARAISDHDKRFLVVHGLRIGFQGLRTSRDALSPIVSEIRRFLEPKGIGPYGGSLVLNDSGQDIVEVQVGLTMDALTMRDVEPGSMQIVPLPAEGRDKVSISVLLADGHRLALQVSIELPDRMPVLVQVKVTADRIGPRDATWFW